MRHGARSRFNSKLGINQDRYRRQQTLQFETLEPRRVLAATVYYDLGFGFPDGLSVSDATVDDLNGPQVFGDSYELSNFSQDLLDTYPNHDADDIQAYVDEIADELRAIFEPFDIQVEYAQATSLADMQASLAATPTNDSYIYIGGMVPESVPSDFGAAVFDEGNTQDNLGFVFTFQQDLNFLYRSRGIAAAIARQSGISFGLHTTETSQSAGRGNVMSIVGTDSEGNPTTGSSPHLPSWEFRQIEMDRTLQDGVSPGQTHSFDELVSITGKNTSGIEYITAGGADDTITVELTNLNTANITINDQTQLDVDISNGLVIRNPGDYLQRDQINFLGQAFDVVASDQLVQITPNIQIESRSTQYGYIDIALDDFEDTLEFQVSEDGARTSSIDLRGGDDVVTYTTDNEFPNNTFDIRGGEGDDRFIVPHNISMHKNLDGGPGVDTIDMPNGGIAHVWDVDSEGFTFGFHDEQSFHFPRHTRFEIVAGSAHVFQGGANCQVADKNGCTPPTVPVSIRETTTIVDGGVTLTDQATGQTLVAEDAQGAYGKQVFILSTARDMVIHGQNIQISSDLRIENSTTQSINHNITTYTPFPGSYDVVVSNLAGNALEVSRGVDGADSDFIGLFGGALRANGRANLTIHGSNAEADTFLFDGSVRKQSGPLNVVAYGHGGDDYFEVGSGIDDRNGNLDFILNGFGSSLELVGGQGDDYVYVNDEGSFGKYHFELNSTSIRDTTPIGFANARSDFRLLYDNVETVRMTANNKQNTFRVEPSLTNVFIIHGGDRFGVQDQMALIGNAPTDRYQIDGSQLGSGTWWFGGDDDDAKMILFESIEFQAQSDRLAVASQAGSSPVVHVFDVSTGSFLYELQPYGRGFKNGIQVATGDLTGDGIADIVVAPGWGRFSQIAIYDGRNGQFLSDFYAYPSNEPNLSDNFLGGVDIAIANVAGDAKNEIITSTLWGTSDVRVFSQIYGLEFELKTAFNPFEGSARVDGVRIATGDFNYDGYHNIVSSAAPGNAPLVTATSLTSDFIQKTTEIGFQGHVDNYLGGFNVEVARTNSHLEPEILLTGANTGSSADPFSGQVRFFEGSDLPENYEHKPAPFYNAQIFDVATTRSVSVSSRDTDLDGIVDLAFMAQRAVEGGNTNGEIKVFNLQSNFATLDSLFANDSVFDGGMELG